MLLKISDGAGGWVLFDNVDQVHMLASQHRVRSREELERVNANGSAAINLVPKDCLAEDDLIDIGVIEFQRNGLKSRALFTTVAYICNDTGDTIERVNVRTQQHMRKR